MRPGGLNKGRILPLLMTHLFARMPLLPHGMMDNGIGVDNLVITRLIPSMGGQMRTSNQNWPAVRAINLEDLRGDGADKVDDSNLGDGADDGGFDPNDYKGHGTLHHPLLLPCSQCMSRQPTLRTTMNSRSSGATPVTKTGTLFTGLPCLPQGPEG